MRRISRQGKVAENDQKPADRHWNLGRIDLDPNHGESDGAQWYMTESESTPYSRELDAQIPQVGWSAAA